MTVMIHGERDVKDVSDVIAADEDRAPVLAVDLDRSLLRVDMLHEQVLAALASDPAALFEGVRAGRRGRAAMKAELASRIDFDPALLPYNADVIDRIERWRDEGGIAVLATASSSSVAERIADHLGIFDAVVGSDGEENLKGRAKADRLVEMFGDRGFAYLGDSAADLAVWRHADLAVTVGCPPARQAAAEKAAGAAEHLPDGRRPARALLRAMRPHQWLKNVLVFMPMIAAHAVSFQTLGLALIAFAAFSLTASSAYLLNDLLDLSADRAHPRKRTRPFASGELSTVTGLLAIPVLILAACGLALAAGPDFLLILSIYFVATLAYSFVLKRRAIVDVCTLAGLYTLRIIAGAAAVGAALSVWFLAFSIFLFLSLAAVKRLSELVDLSARDGDEAAGRGYSVDDLPIIGNIAVSAGFTAVVVLALYLNSEDVSGLYARPEALWGVCCVLLYWVSRATLIAHRGRMPDDPLLFAVRDRTSLACGALSAICVALAI